MSTQGNKLIRNLHLDPEKNSGTTVGMQECTNLWDSGNKPLAIEQEELSQNQPKDPLTHTPNPSNFSPNLPIFS